MYASDSFLRLTGITQAQARTWAGATCCIQRMWQRRSPLWQECVHTGEHWYREHRYRGADGRYHPLLAQGVPMRDDDGKHTGWAGINLDISRIKETEDALREADRRKDDFRDARRHELRNPLAPIRRGKAAGHQGTGRNAGPDSPRDHRPPGGAHGPAAG